jgi:hypothetical protein
LFDSTEEEFTTGTLEEEKQKILAMLSEIRKLSTRLKIIPTSKKYAVARGRLIVIMSHLIRELNIRSGYREQIIESLSEKLKAVDKLETSRQELDAVLAGVKGKNILQVQPPTAGGALPLGSAFIDPLSRSPDGR